MKIERKVSNGVDTTLKYSGDALEIITKPDMRQINQVLRQNEIDRNNHASKGVSVTSNPTGVKIASIPQYIIQYWEEEGFYLFSPKRSKMNPEEHQKELFKRLNGDWAALNTSRYKRL